METIIKIFKIISVSTVIYSSMQFGITSIYAIETDEGNILNQVIAAVYVDPVSPTILLGSSLKLIATAVDQNGVVMNPNPTFIWTSDNQGVVTVDSDGNIKGISEGIGTITATNGLVSGTVIITVTNEVQPQLLSTIYVDTLNPKIMSGSNLKLIATAIDQNGVVMSSGQSFTWTSNNQGIVTVDTNGNIKGISEGTAIITATNGLVSGITVITVVPAVTSLTSHIITKLLIDTFDPTIYSGSKLQLITTTFNQSGVVTNPSYGVTWSSDNEGVVTVDASGMITGVSAGTGLIVAIADGIAGVSLVTVIPEVQSSNFTYLFVDFYNPTIYSDSKLQLMATPFDQNGVVTHQASETIWSSDNEGVVTVDGSGMITGVSAGTGLITATSGIISGSSLVTVKPPIQTSTINLLPGWNMITLPIQPIDSSGTSINYTAESFGRLVGADVVTGWDNQNQTYGSHVIGSINDFVFVNGVGYFIHTTTATGITLAGSNFPQIIPSVNSGWNLLGSNSTVPIKASEFGLSFSGADVVSKFDNITQQWTSHIINFPLNDFVINQGDGIFLHK